jgi:hypothetical protein
MFDRVIVCETDTSATARPPVVALRDGARLVLVLTVAGREAEQE